jgi:Ca2+ transporting ATPase
MENAFLRTPAESLEYFKVTEHTGLSQDAVAESKKQYGPNGESTSTPTPEKH